MAALKGFNAIVTAFHNRVGPPALMVVDDFGLPIAHRLKGTSDSGVVDLVALLTPSLESPFRDGKAGGAVVPGRKRFFPLPYALLFVRTYNITGIADVFPFSAPV